MNTAGGPTINGDGYDAVIAAHVAPLEAAEREAAKLADPAWADAETFADEWASTQPWMRGERQ